MGLARTLGSLVVVGALAGSGYAAYELYDAQEVRAELDELRADVRELRDGQVGLRAGSITAADLARLNQLVRTLDEDLAGLQGQLHAETARLDELEGVDDLRTSVTELRNDVGRLSRWSDLLADCLEQGLVVNESTGRARCPT